MYEGVTVEIITIFTDNNLVLVEDRDGNFFEISANQLEKLN